MKQSSATRKNVGAAVLSIAAFIGLSSGTASAVDLTEGCNLSELDPTVGYAIMSKSTNAPFTVSSDVTFTGGFTFGSDAYPYGIGVKTLFELGDKTVYVKDTSLLCKLITDGELYFHGGTFKNNVTFNTCWWGDSKTDNAKISLDGTKLSLGGIAFNGFYGANTQVRLDNGASLEANQVFLFSPHDAATAFSTNNLVFVAGGSSLRANAVLFDYNKAGEAAGAVGANRVVITGAGTYFGCTEPAFDTVFAVGVYTSQNTATLTDHANAYFANVTVGRANTVSNEFVVEDGAYFRTQQHIVVGDGAGADYNRLVFRNGAGQLFKNDGSTITCGNGGCHNELLFDNAWFSNACVTVCGALAGSDHNRVEFRGPQTTVVPASSAVLNMFGLGRRNEYVFRGCTNGWSTLNASMSKESSGVTSTSNMASVVDGAYLRVLNFQVSSGASRGNTLFVGNGGTLASGGEIRIAGTDNSLVVSNATILASESGNALSIGPAFSGSYADGGGDQLVFKGTSPKVGRIDPEKNVICYLHKDSVVTFDVSEGPYVAPVFDDATLVLLGQSRLCITGVAECQKMLSKSTNILLARSFEFGKEYWETHEGTLEQLLEETNASMPDGCYAFVRDGSLYLHVRALTGLVITVR